ncbi:hypothetical protein PAAG_11954 [Paracoccidioides lutzii Pb01]|uniref:catechol O-methyltransferase n=1 Tax=Paracoccidioides lutzii (strain ATCC MYA-826 / Pb01) TaxID=502779 RepID=A0A0A2V1J0_PARBA|nr:hypothetical protein PAAG_11954 [Paracoccidioides lutzii Pb01]KGQ01373.1 hypothetical protein PAAG_11954 [Paracoccidioides lutzii Pb01]
MMGVDRPYLPKPETHCGDGREVELLQYIYSLPNLEELRGSPSKIVEAIDQYGRDNYYLMNVGSVKGPIITSLIAAVKPQVMVELGGYVGYSAILFGDAVRKAGGKRYYSLEKDPVFGAVSTLLLNLAGLGDFVQVIIGPSDISLYNLHRSGTINRIDLLFLDHYKPAYVVDLKLCEQLGMIVPGSILAADNVISPGNPPYLKYVRSNVEEKRHEAASNPAACRGYDLRGFSKSIINRYGISGEKAMTAVSISGNPNLIYESRLVNSFEPTGEPRNPNPANDAGKDYPGIQSYRSTEEMVKVASADVVVVSTITETNFAFAKLALEAEEHAIVKKLFIPARQEASELVALSERQKRLISVYQNRRWDADFITLSTLIPTNSSWETKAMPVNGALYDLGTHLIDQVVYLLGLPKKLTGFVGSQREDNDSGDEDSFTLLLHYDRILATVKGAIISPEEKQLRFLGDSIVLPFKKINSEQAQGMAITVTARNQVTDMVSTSSNKFSALIYESS